MGLRESFCMNRKHGGAKSREAREICELMSDKVVPWTGQGPGIKNGLMQLQPGELIKKD